MPLKALPDKEQFLKLWVRLQFALRNPSVRPLLAEGVVSKTRVLAYLGSREEAEIVVAYEHVAQVRLQYL